MAMNTATKLPSYSVEFLPLERRLLERRNASPHLTFLLSENRHFERRQSPAEATAANQRVTALRKN
jgi:hypothetical protein